MGIKIGAATGGSSHRLVVWFPPPEEAAYVREWLDRVARLEFRPQVGRDLGARLTHAFARHFADGAKRVVIIGTDCPGVTRHLIHQAFTALGRRDVALGPALDGGYYLIGLAAPQAALFRGISRSTGAGAGQA